MEDRLRQLKAREAELLRYEELKQAEAAMLAEKNRQHGDYYLDKAKQGVSGLFSAPGLIVDAANLPFRAIDSVMGTNHFSNPVGGSGQLREMNDAALGVEYKAPQNTIEKWAGPVVEAAAGSLLPSVAGVGLAKTGTKLATAGIEALSTVGGGLGQTLGGDIAEGVGADRSVGEAFGAVAGGLTPILSGSAITEGAGSIKNLVSKEGRNAAAARKVANQLNIASSPEAGTNVVRTARLMSEIPGFRPTIDQATDSAGLKALKRNYAQESAANLGKVKEVERSNFSAINAEKDKRFPGSDDITGTLQKDYETQQTRLNAQIAKNQVEVDRLASMFAKKPSAEIGQRLREKKIENEKIVREEKSRRYNEVVENSKDVKIPIDDLVNVVEELKAKAGIEKVPPELNLILDKYKTDSILVDPRGTPSPSSISMDDFLTIRRVANRAYEKAKSSTDWTPTYYLKNVIGWAKNKIDELPTEVANDLRAADAYYQSEYRNVFRKDLGYEITKGTASKTYNTVDEDIVRKLIVKKDNKKAIDDFRKIYGDDPEANALLTDGILDVAYEYGIFDKTGSVDAARVAAFKKDYSQALDQLPEVKQIFDQSESLASRINTRRASLEAAKTAQSRSTLAHLAGAENIDDVLSQAYKSKKTMFTLVARAKRAGVGDDLARVIANDLMSSGDPYGKLMKHKDTLKPALATLSKNHWENLETLSEAYSVASRGQVGDTARAAAISEPMTDKLGVSVPSLESRIRAMKEGRISENYLVVGIGSRFLSRFKADHQKKLMEEALFNPELADDLVTLYRSPSIVSEDLFARLAFHVSSLGLRGAVQLTQEEEGDSRVGR